MRGLRPSLVVTVTTLHSCPQLLFVSESDDAALLVTEHSSFLLGFGRPFVVTESVHCCFIKTRFALKAPG